MSTEYAISFDSPDLVATANELRQLPSARELTSTPSTFELRANPSAEGMPDATVQAQPYGAYFCDHGGSGQEFLGLVVTRFVQKFGCVRVDDLEVAWLLELSALHKRSVQIAGLFHDLLKRNPGSNVTEPGLIFSRRLASALARQNCPKDLARHRATRTLKYLRTMKGIPYAMLQKLASDVITWSKLENAH